MMKEDNDRGELPGPQAPLPPAPPPVTAPIPGPTAPPPAAPPRTSAPPIGPVRSAPSETIVRDRRPSSNLPISLPGAEGGSFATPGTRAIAPFRTPNFYQGRFVGPGSGSFGEGSVYAGGGPGLDGGAVGNDGEEQGGLTDDDLKNSIVSRLMAKQGPNGMGY